jgi:hypothetical protein
LNEKFKIFNCKEREYSYEDYQNDLLFRQFAETAEKCGDLRRFIDTNKWNSPYF